MGAIVTAQDTKTLVHVLKERMPALRQIAAKHMDSQRLFRLVVANVTRTPALRECSIDSIFRSTQQAAELGLEPGSATGEGYLVPYRNAKLNCMECQFIPGYRGLIALAFRSGHVKNVRSHAVFAGDEFEFELGLNPKLRHVPGPDVDRDDTSKLTHVYCIVDLKDGGVLYDVMTRKEVDRIRRMSKSHDRGPWVEHYVEQARKTVVRRTLKYAPMSVEMSRAVALDDHADGYSEAFDIEWSDVDEESEAPAPKSQKLKDKIPPPPTDEGSGEGGADSEPQGTEEDAIAFLNEVGLTVKQREQVTSARYWVTRVLKLKADGVTSVTELLEQIGTAQ